MADEGTFATTAEVQYKAGADASTTANTESYINVYIKQAESYINVLSRYNWTDNYAGLNADVKHILKEAASNLAAIYVITYDLSGFISPVEAQTKLDVLYQRFSECLNLLKEKYVQTWINNA
jgi:hypothetical protein